MFTVTTYRAGVKGYAIYLDGQLAGKMTGTSVKGALPWRLGSSPPTHCMDEPRRRAMPIGFYNVVTTGYLVAGHNDLKVFFIKLKTWMDQIAHLGPSRW